LLFTLESSHPFSTVKEAKSQTQLYPSNHLLYLPDD
jgi:hypothetical protein